MIDSRKIDEIVGKIVHGYHPDKIIMFGSYAAGNYDSHSDLDLFLVKDSEIPRPQRGIEVRKLLRGSKTPIDLIVYTPKEIEKEITSMYSFVSEVFKTGKLLYERTA